MIINPVRHAGRLFSHRHFLALNNDIHDYLPRARYKEFLHSWIINNLLVGPKKRRRFERRHSCTLPAMINLSPTEKCNLNCVGCYAANYSRHSEMSPTQMETIIREARNLGIYFVGFLGGEPFLRGDIFSVIENNKDMAFRISTNGTILDNRIVDSLKRCGNLVLFLSLEGLENDTDMWRGSGVYSTIMQTMSTLKQEQILFGFSVLFHKKNLATVVSQAFLDTMQDAGCRFGLFFPYGPIGDNARYDLALEEGQIEGTFTKLTALEGKYRMLLLKEGYKAPATSRNFLLEQGCRAGVTIHITPEGYAEPCNGIQFYAVNVFEQGLEQVFQSRFYKDIYECVEYKDRHCVGMFSPEEVLEIVKRNNAKGSHPRALDAYTHYSQFHVARGSPINQGSQKGQEG